MVPLWVSGISGVAVVALAVSFLYGLTSKGKTCTGVGAVVANGRESARIGSEMLMNGGSAVDAVIATLICEGAMCPQSMGIGGGFCGIVYTKSDRQIATITARECAPRAAHKNMFVGQSVITGPLSCGVPGEIMGYWEMHQRYGRLPWKALFEPTIKICREGIWISKHLATALKINEHRVRGQRNMAEIFLKPDGTLVTEGDYIKRPALADSLERIANNGVREMYGGGLTGRMFVEDVQCMGGIITENDLRNYKCEWHESDLVTANVIGDLKLYTTCLPTSGAVLAFILNVMKDLYTTDLPKCWQRIIETFKHAYGLRSNLGDMVNDAEIAGLIQESYSNLLNQDFVKHVRSMIFDDKTFTDMAHYNANFTVTEDNGTTNIAVLAANGDAIVINSTVNNYLGAKVRSTRTGIILNDEMDDFSTPGLVNSYGVPASPANFIKPGKRPMSSMCPSIILDKAGNVRMLVGSAGGTKITTAVAAAIIKYLVFNEPIEHAVNDGRLHHQLAPMLIVSDPEVSVVLRDYLTKVGHQVQLAEPNTGFAAMSVIGVRNGVPEPLIDRRRLGSTAVVRYKYIK